MDTVDSMSVTRIQDYRIRGGATSPPAEPTPIGVNATTWTGTAREVAPTRPPAPCDPSSTMSADYAGWPTRVARPTTAPVAGNLATGNPVAASGQIAMPPAAGAQPQGSWLARWQRRNAGKRWWKVFLLGLAAYLDATLLLGFDHNLHTLPLVILLASAVVPVTFVVYCWERGALADLPASIVGLAFVGGAVLAILIAAPLEDFFVLPIRFIGPLTIAVIEEAAKALAVIWFLRDRRARGELNGLVLGAAAGMGFATLETAGYGFDVFLHGYTVALAGAPSFSLPSFASAVSVGIFWMTFVLIQRMALAIFMHGAWTAIVCAAIWRDRGPRGLRVTWGVGLAFAVSVALHTLWDCGGALGLLPFLLLAVPLVGAPGLLMLRFFLREASDRAQLGALAAPPAPLLKALAMYLIHPWRRPLLPVARPPARQQPEPAPGWTPSATASRWGAPPAFRPPAAWASTPRYPAPSYPQRASGLRVDGFPRPVGG